MIRLSEAFAKMRLSNEVTPEDVEQAIDLINIATLKSAVDPETGLIDMDILTTGRTLTSLKRSQ
jgi:DNA replication licensing factor MCM4